MDKMVLYFAAFFVLALVFIYKHAQRMEIFNREKIFDLFIEEISKHKNKILDYDLLGILARISKENIYDSRYSDFEIDLFVIMNKNQETRIYFTREDLYNSCMVYKGGYKTAINYYLYFF